MANTRAATGPVTGLAAERPAASEPVASLLPVASGNTQAVGPTRRAVVGLTPRSGPPRRPGCWARAAGLSAGQELPVVGSLGRLGWAGDSDGLPVFEVQL